MELRVIALPAKVDCCGELFAVYSNECKRTRGLREKKSTRVPAFLLTVPNASIAVLFGQARSVTSLALPIMGGAPVECFA
jgi:hypothetical protein